MGIKVSRQLRGHFLTDAQRSLWGETGCVSLTFGNSLKGSWRFSYFTRCYASHVRLRLQVKTIILELCVMRMSVRKWLFSLGISTCRCAGPRMKASLYEEMSSYVKHFLRLTYFSFDTGIPDKKTPKRTICFHCLKGKRSSFEYCNSGIILNKCTWFCSMEENFFLHELRVWATCHEVVFTRLS